MKKKLLIILSILLLPISVSAKNHIYSINQNIYLNEDGSANISEIWDVDGSDGTEWYKVVNGQTSDTLTNFKVSMDGKDLKYKAWDVDESLGQKKGYYGINETYTGVELCFGKYDYNRHKFTLTYNIKDYITNTEDAQVLYWTLIDKLSNVDFDKFSAQISSYYSFPDTLDVWGYGYKGYAYVENGVIKLSTEENSNMNDAYTVALVKFPAGTFKSEKAFPGVTTFDEILNMAENGTFEYNYEKTFWQKALEVLSYLASFLPMIIFFLIMIFVSKSSKYGYINNKTITKKNTNMFREIPCNKNIYYANTLNQLNNFSYKETNILGAIILKWVKEDKIRFMNETKGVFNKETSSIDLRLNPTFDFEPEAELFKYMYEASKDGILESKELEKWARTHYNKFFNLFQKINKFEINRLTSTQDIRKRISKEECKYHNVLSDKLYEDSSQLFGLKLYLEEFAAMDTKEVMDVKMWDEYLMFAYLFGIADKVAKQLKNLYPQILEDPNINYDYNTLMFINHISNSSVSAASSARTAAQNYSSGGGGFSSGGGGGGSFGGGGGGSR